MTIFEGLGGERDVSRCAAKEAIMYGLYNVVSVQKLLVPSTDSLSLSCVLLLHVLFIDYLRITTNRFEPGV